MKFPGPPAGPSSPAPPRNPAPLPRPAPPPPPRPNRAVMSNDTGMALATAAVFISAGMSLIVAPLGHTKAWNLPTGYTADLLIVPLFIVFTLVSLALTPPRRDRRLRDAPAGAAVSGRARQPHQAPAAAAQGWTSAAG